MPQRTLTFAKLFDIDGQQVLFEALPSSDPHKREEGMPDVMVSVDLGWSFYEARIGLQLNEMGRADIIDPHAWLVGSFTEDKARDQLEKIQSEFGGQAIVDRMLASGEYSLGDEDDVEEMTALQDAQGAPFAKLFELDGRQALVLRRHDLGEDEETDGVLVKVAKPNGEVAETRVEGVDFEAVDAAWTQHYVDAAVASEKRRAHSLN